MFASWCGYWGVGIFQELTVNQHDTTCSTAFCINNNFSADGVRGRDRKHGTHEALEVESVQHRTGIIYLLMSRRPRSTARHIYQERKKVSRNVCRHHLSRWNHALHPLLPSTIKCSTYGWFFARLFVYFLDLRAWISSDNFFLVCMLPFRLFDLFLRI